MRKPRIIIATAIVCFCGTAYAKDPGWTDTEWRTFLDSLRMVETGGEANDGIGSVGDNGSAIGPYQVWEPYFRDAVEYDPTIVCDYADIQDSKEMSERVVRAYIKRYLPKGGTMEDAARIHNGGPKGHKKESTVSYAKKFVRFMKKIKENLL